MAEGKRHLPVLPSSAGAGGGGAASGGDPEEQDRTTWHWAAIGAVAVFLVWLPLAALAAYALRGVIEADAASGETRVLVLVVNGVAFAFACFVGGFLVGRYGNRAGIQQATAAGVLAATVAWTMAWVSGPVPGILLWAVVLVVLASIGGAAARLGGGLGLRRRPR